MRIITNILLIALLSGMILIFNQCTGYEPKSRPKNVAAIYNPSAARFHPQYFVYHINDSVSQVFFRVHKKELHSNTANPDKILKAKFSIKFKLYESFVSGVIADSSSYIYDIPLHSDQDYYVSNFPILMPSEKIYSLELTSTDMLRYSSLISYLNVDKRNKLSSQNFMIRTMTGNPVFSRYVLPGSKFRIENVRMEMDSLRIEKYPTIENMPTPPFSLAKIKSQSITSDTSWNVAYNQNTTFSFSEKGIYMIKADTLQRFGLSIFLFGPHFPETKTASSLLGPIRYLSSLKEYRTLLSYSDPKVAVDSFWLATSGNMNRSKELIRIYYSRVFFANYYFSHYTEGWLSDRGMIYTIYGPPKTIYKSDNAERWIYGDNKNLLSMDFYFERQYHPFSDNNFILQRQEVYKSSWYQAVDTWKNGRVYSVMN